MNQAVYNGSSPTPSNVDLENQFLLNDIHDYVKRFLETHKNCSYVYLTLWVMNELGIKRMSDIIKTIARVQKILDKIMSDLNELQRLLQEFQDLGWGKDPYDPTGKRDWDPTDHDEYNNRLQMERQAKAWLDKIDPGAGDLTNAQRMQRVWKELFVGGISPEGKHVDGLLTQFFWASKSQYFPQDLGSAYESLKALNSDSFAGASAAWSKDGVTFLDFLQGKPSYLEIAEIFGKAFSNSWFKRTGEHPDDQKEKQYNDDVGDVMDPLKTTNQTCNGLNTQQSSTMSMYTQQLTSDIQIVQQVVQKGGEETKTYANNQIAR